MFLLISQKLSEASDPGYNNNAPEVNAVQNTSVASAEGYKYHREKLIDYDLLLNESYRGQMEVYSFPDSRYISAAIKLYIGDYDDQFREAAEKPLRFIAELNPIVSMSNAAIIMYTGENMFNEQVSQSQRWIAAPVIFVVSIPGVGTILYLDDGSILITQIVLNEATK